MAYPVMSAGLSRKRHRTGHRSLTTPRRLPGRPSTVPTFGATGGRVGPTATGGTITPGGTPPSPTPPKPVAPPKLPENEAARINAETTYGVSQGDLNHQLYLAALHYGDPNLVAKYKGYAGAGDLAEDPNNVLATNRRWSDQSKLDLGNNLLGNNTFFSGIHEKGLGQIGDELTRKNTAGYDDFQTSMGTITSELAKAKAARDEAYRSADAADLQSFLSTPPEPQEGAPPPMQFSQADWQKIFQQTAGKPVQHTRRRTRHVRR